MPDAGQKETRRQENKETIDEFEGMSPFAKVMTEMGPYLNLGTVFVASIGTFGLLGWWLDKKLGTGQWLLGIGATLGIVVGFVNFFKVVLNIGKRKNQT